MSCQDHIRLKVGYDMNVKVLYIKYKKSHFSQLSHKRNIYDYVNRHLEFDLVATFARHIHCTAL